MTTLLRDWSRPLSRLTLLAVAGVAFLGTLPATLQAYAWLPPLWIKVSGALQESSGPTGVLLAAIAALTSSQIADRSILSARGRVRSGIPIVARQCSRLVLAAWVGASIAFVPALVATALRATAGQPAIGVVVVGYLVLALWVMVGYAIGALLTPKLAIPVAIVAALVIWLLPQFIRNPPIFSIAPVWGLDWPYLGDVWDPLTTLFRVVFFVGAVCALGIFAGRYMDGGSTSARVAARASVPLLPVVAIAAISVIQNPTLVLIERDPPLDCSSGANYETCVHRGFAELLDSASEATSAVATIAGVDSIRAAELSAVSGLDDRPDVVIRADLRSIADFEDYWASEVAYTIAGVESCFHPTEDIQDSVEPQEAVESIAREIATRAGYGFRSRIVSSTGGALWADAPLAVELSSLSDQDFRSWLTDNQAAIHSCTVGAR